MLLTVRGMSTEAGMGGDGRTEPYAYCAGGKQPAACVADPVPHSGGRTTSGEVGHGEDHHKYNEDDHPISVLETKERHQRSIQYEGHEYHLPFTLSGLATSTSYSPLRRRSTVAKTPGGRSDVD